MTSGEWIGVAAFITGVLGTFLGAFFGRNKAASDAAEATAAEIRLAKTDREFIEEFFQVIRRFIAAVEDHAAALRALTKARQ